MRMTQKDMKETPIYIQTRRDTKWRVPPIGYPQCATNECVPDRLGYCIVCGHEVVRETDEDGNPTRVE